MKLIVASDRRFFLQADGTPCCADGSRGYGFWSRYLEAFDSVQVVARLARKIHRSGFPVEGDRVSLTSLENYVGPSEYLRRRSTIKKQVAEACQKEAAYLLRVPGYVGSLMQRCLHRLNRPYSVEVVADPYTLFAPGACDHPLRPLIRWDCIRRLREQCRQAASAVYVTDKALQSSYLPGTSTYAIGCSDVEMPSEAFIASPRPVDSFCRPFTVVMVGTLAQLYKAPHILIDAFANSLQRIPNSELVFIGDGKHQSQLEEQCLRLGTSKCVRFLGRLPAGEQVRRQLDQADLFVLPSFQEGLPRALIEAMGRGLPCVASEVGGISELLEPDCMVPAGQVEPLASKLVEVLGDPARLARESRRNLEVARRYHSDVLRPRRIEFYRHLRDQTHAWMSRKAA